VLGAGEQAGLQLEALMLVRPIVDARLWARDPARAHAAAADLTARLGISVRAAASGHAACRGADVIVTTTPAERPILMAGWLEPGQHVTAMGSDAEHKNEIDPAAFAKISYVADGLAQTRRLGELAHAIKAGTASAERWFPELGQVIAGRTAGRNSTADITLCDLTGTGVQDTAIATLAHRRAVAAGAGQVFEIAGHRKGAA
jgi:ornithine cyclodeaminase